MAERKDLKALITEILSHEGIEINLSGDLINNELILDSFDIVRLVIQLNNALDIQISASEILPENFYSIFSIEKFLEKKLGY